MKLKEYRKILSQYFENYDIDYILSKILKCSKTELLFTDEISTNDIKKVDKIVREYKKGKPLNKIFHESEFFGLTFYINNSVLAPRKETELLVENVLNYVGHKSVEILDMCTGSGAIAISLKNSCFCDVDAVDVSLKALKVAKKNAKNCDVRVNFVKSNMFKNLKQKKYDVIVSNPPYIKSTDKKLAKELKYDPKIALFGGKDGLKFYRIIFSNATEFLKKDGRIFVEIGYDIKEEVLKIVPENLVVTNIIKDYSNIDRIIELKFKD